MVPSACKKYAICTGHNFGLLKTNTQSMVFVWICVRCLYMMVSFLYDLYVQSTPFKMGCLQTMFWFLRYFAHCSYFVVSANFGLIFVTSAHCFHVFVPQLTSCFIAVKSLALSLCHKDFFHSNHAHKLVSLIQMLKFMKKQHIFEKKNQHQIVCDFMTWAEVWTPAHVPPKPPLTLVQFSHDCYNGIFVRYMLCSHVFLYLHATCICTYLLLLSLCSHVLFSFLVLFFFAIFTLCFQFCY